MNRFGLIGEHLSHSLSAVIHTRLLDLLGLQGSYDMVELSPQEALSAAEHLAKRGFDGFNVTIPYKEVLLPQMHRLSAQAQAIGAVNTVKIHREGSTLSLSGHNTDYAGFGRMISQMPLSLEGETVAVLGIGGAFRAVAAYLLDQGVERLVAVTRRPGQEQPLAEKDPRLQIIGYPELNEISGALLVNTTPVGMFPKGGVSPVGEEVVARFDTAADIIYNPKETEFLRLAGSLGKPAVNGMTMLVAQAVAAEEIWLERAIDPDIIPLLVKETQEVLEKGWPAV